MTWLWCTGILQARGIGVGHSLTCKCRDADIASENARNSHIDILTRSLGRRCPVPCNCRVASVHGVRQATNGPARPLLLLPPVLHVGPCNRSGEGGARNAGLGKRRIHRGGCRGC